MVMLVLTASISPEEKAENHAQNEWLRGSGDTGDICLQHIIVITVTITQFFILWHMIANIPFLQLFGFRIFPDVFVSKIIVSGRGVIMIPT
jgi:hypothetical protein